jgi:hypothetical protein
VTRSQPLVEPPPLADADKLGFWADEVAEYEAILRKPYSSLDDADCIWIVGEAEIFLPADHIRYFAPALVEHCRTHIEDTHYLNGTIAALLKGIPLPGAHQVAAELQDLLARFPMQRFPMPIRGIDWRSGAQPGLLPGRLLRLAMEVELSSVDFAALGTTGPAAMALVELAFGLFEENWDYPGGSSVADTILELLEKIARGSDRHAGLGARFVLGEVPPESLPGCSDPDCSAHPDR